MASYYIACDDTPSQTANGSYNRCDATTSVILTQEAVSDIYSPPLTIADANLYGAGIFSCWAVVYISKQAANLFGGYRTK